MPELICPLCGGLLQNKEKSYLCPKGHCFDRAKSGYVNLLPPTGSGKRHGDDKLMVRSRSRFLDKGFYDPLSREISRCAESISPESVHIVDAGCGEGKYSAELLEHLESRGRQADLVGVDISKEALICAARRSKKLKLCAASTAHMPLADGCADIVLNIFSPFMPEEFLRVLKDSGRLIRVVPLENHLWELKELIYDHPYPNPPMDMEAEGFRIVREQKLCYEIELRSSQEIMDLFMMTPYYYKTGAADQEKAQRAEFLRTRVEFGIYVYEKL